MVDLAGGTADAGGSLIHEAPAREPIALPDGFVSQLIGVEYTDDEVHDALAEIGGAITRTDDGFDVVPPSWRPDLTGKAELAEEVARLAGYHRIPSVLPVAPPGRGLTRSQRVRRRVADTLAAAGSTEVLSFPFATEAENGTYGSVDGEPVASVRLANALDAGAALLRRSLLPGLVAAARRNRSRGLTDLSLFELGLVFLPEVGRAYGTDGLPVGDARAERRRPRDAAGRHPAAAASRGRAPRRRRRDEAARPAAPLPPASSTRSTRCGRSHSRRVPRSRSCRARTRRCTRAAQPSSGWPGARSGSPANCCPRSRRRPTCLAWSPSSNSTSTPSSSSRTRASRHDQIGTFPAATQDLSLVVDADVPAAAVAAAVREGAGDLLEHLHLVDDYRGSGVPAGTKSLTFALRFRAPDRTLTAAEASAAKLAGAALAAERYGATIRE